MSNPTDAGEESKGLSLDILEVIHTAHSQNGLRHPLNDYKRYREYCTRRLRRLRRNLKFTCGRGKFTKKNINTDNVTTAKFLLIPLMNAERAWSMAMELKKEYDQDPEEKIRLKFHLFRRLAKAAKWSAELQRVATSVADARTILESDAYHAFMEGNIYLERENWADALPRFLHSQTVYTQLCNIADPELQALYRERAEQLDHNVRFCTYKQKRLVAMTGGSSEEGLNLDDLQADIDDLLRSKLESAASEVRSKAAESLEKVTFEGRVVPVKSNKVRVLLLQAQEQEAKLEQLASSASADSKEDQNESQMSVFQSIFQTYDDAMQLTRQDLRDLSQVEMKTAKTAVQEEQLQNLIDYIAASKLRRVMERNFLIANSLRAQILSKRSENQFNLGGAREEKKASKKKRVKPDDLVRIYEILLQNIEGLSRVFSGNSDFANQLAAKNLYCIAHRCFWMAESYAALKKWAEAHLLLERAVYNATLALNSPNTGFDNSAVESLHEVISSAKKQQAVVHATALLDGGSSDQSQQDLSNLSVIERLDTYSTGEIAHIPPQLQPVPCKPVLFDIASNFVQFNSLEAKMKKKGGFFSFFRR